MHHTTHETLLCLCSTLVGWLCSNVDWHFYDINVIVPFMHIASFFAFAVAFVSGALAIIERGSRYFKGKRD